MLPTPDAGFCLPRMLASINVCTCFCLLFADTFEAQRLSVPYGEAFSFC